MYPSFKFVQIDGDTKNRSALIDQFKTDPYTQGLFMTYKVGSEGLNLTEATHCICIEPWWTNAVHSQAKARLWRTGQTKPVYIHNVITKGSIEENIVKICNKKDDMASSYLKGTERTLKGPGLDKFTLGKLLGIRY
jgi:SNF2 family DNA or RNA helicase